jgi:hypothetical protein
VSPPPQNQTPSINRLTYTTYTTHTTFLYIKYFYERNVIYRGHPDTPEHVYCCYTVLEWGCPIGKIGDTLLPRGDTPGCSGVSHRFGGDTPIKSLKTEVLEKRGVPSFEETPPDKLSRSLGLLCGDFAHHSNDCPLHHCYCCCDVGRSALVSRLRAFLAS